MGAEQIHQPQILADPVIKAERDGFSKAAGKTVFADYEDTSLYSYKL